MPFEQIPYTNFHGTNQDWMIQQIKQMIADWASYRTNLDAAWAAYQKNINSWRQALDAAFTELHTYVHDYFDNLDVQEEINNKLDQMASDGSLDAILRPYFNAYKEEINTIINSQNTTIGTQNTKINVLESQMNAFIQDHPSTTGEKDAELTDIRVGYNGQVYPTAGDAVRTQISDVYDHISIIRQNQPIDLKSLITTPGAVYYTTGGDNNSIASSFSRSDYIKVFKNDFIPYYYFRTNGMAIIAYYNDAKVYDQSHSIEGSNSIINGTWTAPEDGFIRICCRNTELNNTSCECKQFYKLYQDIDYIEQFPNAIKWGVSNQLNDLFWFIGFINVTTGEFTNSTQSIMTPSYYSLSKDIIIRKIAASRLNVIKYLNSEVSRMTVEEGETEFTFTPDQNATYRFCYLRIPYETITDPKEFTNDFVIAYLDDVITENNPVSGMSWVTLGDSLTDDVTLSQFEGVEKLNYTEIVSQHLNLQLTNLGKSGTGYWRHSTTTQEAFYQMALTIPNNTDIVTVFGSFNDMGRDGDISGRQILGTIYDTGTDTVGGCINQTFTNIFETVPDAVVGVILPTPWNEMTITQAELQVYEQYVNLVKGVAERYSLPVLDLFHHSNMRPWNQAFKTTYYKDADGVHPNHYGHMRISGYISDFVESLAKLNK